MSDRERRRGRYRDEPQQSDWDWREQRWERAEREGTRYPGEYDREYAESYGVPSHPGGYGRRGESGWRQPEDWQRQGPYSGLPERRRPTRSQWTSANPYESEHEQPPRGPLYGPYSGAREGYRGGERREEFEVIPGAGYGPFPRGPQRLGLWGGPSLEQGAQRGSSSGYYGARYAARGPKNYQRPDHRIREDICERLWQDAFIDSSEVSVEVQNGEVTLEGTVPERRMKHAIEDIADHCPGVKEIHNRVRVSRSGSPPIGQ